MNCHPSRSACSTGSHASCVGLKRIGAIVGSIDFSDFYIVLSGEVAPGTPLAAAREAGAVVLGLGALASVVINFLILAWIIFLLVKLVNKVLAKPEEAPAPARSWR